MPTAVEAADVQGLVARGYGRLRSARYLLLSCAAPEPARAWLRDLAERITVAEGRPDRTALNVAFTGPGLERLGVRPEAVAGFSRELREGIVSPHRSRALGDEGPSSPEGWDWGGPTAPSVHALLLAFAEDDAALERLVGDELRAAADHGVGEVRRLDTTSLFDREHFGFKDGISQPSIEGLHRIGPSANAVRAGEFLLGYPNEYGHLTPRPLLPPEADPDQLLPRDPDGSGAADLGRSGTYLVMRQIAQDVRGFWEYLDHVTSTAGGRSDPEARVALAARWVGRWPSGAPLALAPERDDPELAGLNDFNYHKTDAEGLRCPLGAHIRRAHPRDSLDPSPGTRRSIAVDKRHRILRRGRSYGPPAEPDELLAASAAAEPERGLHFICLNANIARQFEFIQQTWLNNPTFQGLYDDADVLVGRAVEGGATFTVQHRPVRRRVLDVPRFTRVRGGGYFFLPGRRALRYLAGGAEGSS
jgi:Dyp-type peroxidase family